MVLTDNGTKGIVDVALFPIKVSASNCCTFFVLLQEFGHKRGAHFVESFLRLKLEYLVIEMDFLTLCTRLSVHDSTFHTLSLG